MDLSMNTNNSRNNRDTQQAEFIYRNLGKYYTEIVRSMSDKIFNWAFTLNTGGLIATITFMASAIRWSNFTLKDSRPFVCLLIIFGLGVLFIVLSAKFEHKRFENKGKKLDNLYSEASSDHFIKEIPPQTHCYDFFVPLMENLSYLLFFIGLFVSVIYIV